MFHLCYVNVARLSMLAALAGKSLDLSGFDEALPLHELGWSLARLLSGFKHLLAQLELRAVPIRKALEMREARGLVVSFDETFRTKNINIPRNLAGYSKPLLGNFGVDPHVYFKHKEMKIVANIDLRWVTTTTAFVQFRPSSGKNQFAGLGFINSVDRTTRLVSLTPYLLGMPSNEYMEELWSAMRPHHPS